MYGLLIESIVHHLKQTYGENVWLQIRKAANLQQMAFSTHERYSERVIPNIAEAASQITGKPVEDIMDAFGVAFVTFMAQYGYDKILKVLGRHMRDFLNGLDNLHEYLRFSYSKLRPPSFFVQHESKTGLLLHYRSRRKGFLHYVKGQIRQVGKTFYNTDVKIDVISEDTTDTMTHVVFKLYFDNTAYKEETKTSEQICDALPLKSDVFFELFPFHIVFNKDMVIRHIGCGLQAIMPQILEDRMTDAFMVTRPLVNFTWKNILAHTNNVFELVSLLPVRRENDIQSHEPEKQNFLDGILVHVRPESDLDGYPLHLKGQMMYMHEWDNIIFLGTPVMESLDVMFRTGLYINDLSMHDSSRDLVLAGTQQSAELKLALDQEQRKSRILEESMLKLDLEMKRTDSLLYQMIPKSVADRLRRGEPAITTCEVFDNVTILFSDVVGFTSICSQISPMEVVSMLNAMYTKFDKLSEFHGVYKVETIGDAYMVVSGAPEITKYHGLLICDMALDMLDTMQDLHDPSTGGTMKIRIGIHSGNTVAGVVGIKMPRYCLFGDSVNTASRMETNGEAMKIHISETTKQELEENKYITQERGTITVKGKGTMKTYWLIGKVASDENYFCPFSGIELEDFSKQNDDDLHKKRDNFYSPVSFDDIKKSHNNLQTSAHTSPIKKAVNMFYEKQTNVEVVNGNLDYGLETRGSVVKEKEFGIIRNSIFNNENIQRTSHERHRSQTCMLL
ncbi:hypothetical protein CHS0354_031857 [Potamilus streckersoni]|uniref:guanylate cyclase n=1 Tax=Potamilus streckersoni TaxID=2493646 RepID=A0AAE0RXT8_9BIVA|nr:hypothetical protein CHS0354_031857 [Potamilus streckersoni]